MIFDYLATAMHSTVDFTITTKAPGIPPIGREGTGDGRNWLAGKMQFSCDLSVVWRYFERVSIVAHVQTCYADRFHQICIGGSPQHDIEARWKRVEHAYSSAR